LKVTWEEGPDAALDSAAIRAMFVEKAKGEAPAFRNDGDAAKALAEAAKKLEAVYEAPFVAHAPLEPQNCLAHVRADGCEIWAPSQAPQWGKRAAAQILGLPEEKVTFHVTLLGGGFGRRLMWDYVEEAVHVSRAVGKPVQVVWSREDDMRHDFYRPASYHHVRAGLDANGNLIAWWHRIAAPSISAQVFGGAGRGDQPPDAVDGAANLAYQVPNLRVEYAMANTAVPVGWWRSVYNSQNPFVNESFLDEAAHAAGKDPLEFRRALLPADSRLRGVLDLAAAKAGWGAALPKGRGRGIAAHFCFGSWVAHVAEVTVDVQGRLRVNRLVCAVDCGQVINPDIITAQLEGAAAFALTAVLKGEITLENGRVKQGNFDDYPLLRLDEMPAVEVHLTPSHEPPGGIGEPGVPPVAPAVANAIFAATGKRVRRLPIRPADLQG
jgi:isoquinoline 1-oxidoreductase beta subunit